MEMSPSYPPTMSSSIGTINAVPGIIFGIKSTMLLHAFELCVAAGGRLLLG